MRWILCASVLAALSGCHAYTLDVDGRIAARAAEPIDLQPTDLSPAQPRATFGAPAVDGDLLQVSAPKEGVPPVKKDAVPPEKKPVGKSMLDQLKVPDRLLGFTVKDIQMPKANAPLAEKEAAIQKQFPPLPALPQLAETTMGPEGRPFTLGDLQQIALRSNPLIRQAHLDIEAARGTALQQGLYPNPTLGYEGDTINSGRTPGQQGGFIGQTFKTMGKLNLARAAAMADVNINEQKLRQAESDLQTQVRAGYFAVLSAQKNFEVVKALTQLTDDLYNVLLMQLIVGEVAAYEPMQIRVLAWQSRVALVQAQNRYVSAWKQLAANLGMPTLPLTAVAGQIDMPVPHFERESVLAYVLSNHTDVISAQFGVDKARLLTRLAEVQPYPDVNVNLVVQKDFTTPPFGTTANVNVGVQFPLWDRNQGNIQATRAQLRKAMEDHQRVQNDLSRKTAEVFERYDNNRALLKMYKEQILPNQVQAFRAAVARHSLFGKDQISYNDLVTSQQTLASLINSYLGSLSEQWTSVVDITNLLQTRDLFQIQRTDAVAPVPDVNEIIREGVKQRRQGSPAK